MHPTTEHDFAMKTFVVDHEVQSWIVKEIMLAHDTYHAQQFPHTRHFLLFYDNHARIPLSLAFRYWRIYSQVLSWYNFTTICSRWLFPPTQLLLLGNLIQSPQTSHPLPCALGRPQQGWKARGSPKGAFWRLLIGGPSFGITDLHGK